MQDVDILGEVAAVNKVVTPRGDKRRTPDLVVRNEPTTSRKSATNANVAATPMSATARAKAAHDAEVAQRHQEREELMLEFAQEEATMAAMTPQQRKLRAAFKFADVDNSGVLSGQELEDVLPLIFPQYGEERLHELFDSIMGEADTDGSGNICMEEFVNSKYAQELTTPAVSAADRMKRRIELEKAFRTVDKDDSGMVDAEELKKLIALCFPSLGKKAQLEYYDAIKKECDKSGDGKIEFEEFYNSKYANMLARPAELQHLQDAHVQVLVDAFNRHDADGSGQIDHKELWSLLQGVFPDYDTRSLRAYFDVMVTECDADNSGTISLSEFQRSQYANLLAGVEEELQPQGLDDGSTVSLTARTSRVTQRRKDRIKQNKALQMTNMGTLVEVDPNQPTGAAADGSTGPGVPAHLESQQAQADRYAAVRLAQAQELVSGNARRTLGYRPGPIEAERRYTAITNLFSKWDESSDITKRGSGFIESDELTGVLQRFFNWTDSEAQDNTMKMLGDLDCNTDGKLDWQEFVKFVEKMTCDVQPSMFDQLLKHLHSSIGDASEDAEFDRRERQLGKLFRFWDYDASGRIDQKELTRVLARYNQGDHQGDQSQSERLVKLALESDDSNADGQLSEAEFNTFFQSLAYALSPDDFDFMGFRLRRCIEQVQMLMEGTKANIKYRAALENHLASSVLQDVISSTSCTTPIVMYGTSYDPARAVEKCANFNQISIEPCVVTQVKGETAAMEELRWKGFHRGWWIYIYLSDDYDSDQFLRNIGVELQTKGWYIQKNFRLWIHCPFDNIAHFPHVFMVNSHAIHLDDVRPPDSKVGIVTKPKK